jgi:copper chaperone CopZ
MRANIEGDLAGHPGIAQVTVNVAAKTVRITYDQQQTGPGQLRAMLTQIGYPAAP